MRVFAGTSGYSYKEWKGGFYPADLATNAMLAHYASRLSSVEVNNTFYRVPKPDVVRGWRDEVPEDFRFALKATRRITHVRRLRAAEDETAFMLKQFGDMGERLGAILFQLPPNMKQDVGRLAAYLELLPEGTRAAFEFRHPSWNTEEARACLRARACALVVSDSDDDPAPTGALPVTADWTYLRLRRAAYSDDELRAWGERLGACDVESAFAFFKHEDDGSGPRAAGRFLELVG